MLLLWCGLFLFITKQYLALDVLNKIYFSAEELRQLQFTVNVNSDNKIYLLTSKVPPKAEAKVFANYGIPIKYVHDVVPLSNHTAFKNYFVNAPAGSCLAAINAYETKQKPLEAPCMEKVYCNVLPRNVNETRGRHIQLYGMFCAHIFNNYLYVYYISNAKIVTSSDFYEELFFFDKENVIDCQSDLIDIRIKNVFSDKCNSEELSKKIFNQCNGKNRCTFSEKDSCLKKMFHSHIMYKCKPTCARSSYSVECRQSKDSFYAMCKYGFRRVLKSQYSIKRDECYENYLCYGKQCSLNQYCDNTQKKCVCFNGFEQQGSACLYKDFCKALKCPQGSECVTENGKFPECKCPHEKIFYKNKCYTEHELQQILPDEQANTDVMFYDNLYTYYVLDINHVALNCPRTYTIEALQATSTCYGVNYGSTLIRYFTEELVNACNGKNYCQLSHVMDISNKEFVKPCKEGNVIYKFSYICKAQQIVDENNQLTSVDRFRDKRVAVFFNSLNSTITCDGGKISIHKSHLITEETCPNAKEDIADNLKKYCNGLSHCPVGLIYQFDRFCANGSMLYVSYKCEPFSTTCKYESGVLIGNKHKHECFCKNPFALDRTQNKCLLKTVTPAARCTPEETYRDISLRVTNSGRSIQNKNVKLGICECKREFININGTCVKNKCPLRCPLNKVCVKENNKAAKCECPKNAQLVNTECVCPSKQIVKDGKCVHENLCLIEENKKKCKGAHEHCFHNINTDKVECKCDEHYERKGGVCVQIDYCEKKTCLKNERCENQNNKATCVCDGLFEKKNDKCVYIDKCQNNNGNCPADATCKYYEDKPHECTCKTPGFYYADNACLPEDKCSSETLCPENSVCVNIVNSNPICLCTFNYLKKDGQCLIRNQCLQNNGGCDKNALCRMSGNNVECICKSNYKKDSTNKNKCVPKIKTSDYFFHFSHDKDPIVLLGSCGLLHFNTTRNQIVWKIKDIDESYIFDYTYPNSGTIEVVIRNEEFNSIVYVKKTVGSEVIYDDFLLNHSVCSYSNWFLYLKSEQKLFVA